jgi:hypothetical protein
MTRNAAVIAVVALLLASGCSSSTRGSGRKKEGKDNANVELRMAKGACTVNPVVDRLGGKKGGPIRWNIKNVDCSPQYVAFLEYREYQNGGYGSPEHVVDKDPVYSNQVPTAGSDKVDAKIDKHGCWVCGEDQVFKYKICIDTNPSPPPTGNCLDPDVDVWPGF